MHIRLEQRTLTITLPAEPLGQGGEAAIFGVMSQVAGCPALVAKLYHRPTPEHFAKLAAMIANPPCDPMASAGHVSIAWPIDRVLATGAEQRFLGFVMPRVDKALPIFEFYNPRSRLQRCPLFHYGYLLRTARNLAAAVRAVHERNYVIGDFNESNVLVNNQALVTLVDTDSFQVVDNGRTYRCPVGKPEYTAPELQGVNFPDVDRVAAHDCFGLGVMIFQLLMQGIHPFAGRYTGTGEPGGLAERIAAGHWPYGGDRGGSYAPNPHAPLWSSLPPMIQHLLHDCFEVGHHEPARRPAAAQWQGALDQAETQLTTCRDNTQHLYAESGAGCPWCVMHKRQKRDPFPSERAARAGIPILRPARKVSQALTRVRLQPARQAVSAPPYIPLAVNPSVQVPIVRRSYWASPVTWQQEWGSFFALLLPLFGFGLVVWLLLLAPPSTPQAGPPSTNLEEQQPSSGPERPHVIHLQPAKSK